MNKCLKMNKLSYSKVDDLVNLLACNAEGELNSCLCV